MSYSRLEKFIYAICSMDVTDLPVPLSRIETLWNCLITGETPDFEPLSRNEKYLMAMLDRYDISNLPAPMSRGEQLLYKIAVGETDLSDVPGYLSRYEELLKYLIENSGISGGDFEYVLYTLNQSLYTLYITAEKPVKKAVIYGDTLVNTLQESSSLAVTPMGEDINAQQATITGTANGVIKSAILKGNTLVNVIDNITFSSAINYFVINLKQYKVNENYLFVIANAPIEITQLYFGNASSSMVWKNYTSDFIRNGSTVLLKVTCPSTYDGSEIVPHIKYGSSEPSLDELKQIKVMLIPYQEGMENWDIPYFEGMQSVKMPVLTTTGKNLFNPNAEFNMTDGSYGFIKLTNNKNNSMSVIEKDSTVDMSGIFFGMTENGKNANEGFVWLHENGSLVSTTKINRTYGYFSFFPNNKTTLDKILQRYDIQFEESVTTTTYEPYKSNILTVNEEVELRGIGEVQDELNLLTGELTQRIGEVVLDGSDDEVWDIANNNDILVDVSRFSLRLTDSKTANAKLISDKFKYNNTSLINDEVCYMGGENRLYVNIYKDKLSKNTIKGFRTWLSNNPLTIQYELATESIKTVDLTIQDQDGNTVPHLQAFNETTHITTSSTGLIPNVVIPATVSYPSIIKPSTLYTVKLKRSVTSGTLMINVGGTEQAVTSDCFTITTPSTLTSQDVIFSGKGNVISEVTVVKGDQTAKEYGYFEGIQSVKMPVLTTTGKNLYNDEGGLTNRDINSTTGIESGGNRFVPNAYTQVFPRKTYTLYREKALMNMGLRCYDINKRFINTYTPWVSENILIFNAPSNCYYVKFIDESNSLDNKYAIYLGDHSSNFEYEPFKSNILSTSEDVVLRGIREVKDELDLITGKLTQRIGEVVFNGSEVGWKPITKDGTPAAYVDGYVSYYRMLDNTYTTTMIIDRYKKISSINTASEGFVLNSAYLSNGNNILIRIEQNKIGENSFYSYLRSNPITIQYQLATESVKTVDLTVVDQDNQPTELGTFENVTHVSLEAENLIPEVEMEVATNLLEDTVFTLTDAFNTLYPTAEKPVKSAILKGNTLVSNASSIETVNAQANYINFFTSLDSLQLQLKTSTKYMFVVTTIENTLVSSSDTANIVEFGETDGGNTNQQSAFIDKKRIKYNELNTTQKFILTTKDSFENVNAQMYSRNQLLPNAISGTITLKLMIIEYQEGMENWDIPYFEGMKSVQMPVLTTTGKNLFDGELESGKIDPTKGENQVNNTMVRSKNFVKVKPSTIYTLSYEVDQSLTNVVFYGSNKEFLGVNISKTPQVEGSIGRYINITTTNDTHYLRFYSNSALTITNTSFKSQLEESPTPTTYEPYKSNILTVNEEVELRGIGDVQDTLDCLTGEVIERVGEVVLNGKNDVKISISSASSKYPSITRFWLRDGELSNLLGSSDERIMCDKLPVRADGNYEKITASNGLDIHITTTKLSEETVEAFKEYLSQNPITVQYPLNVASVKTVDLTVIDQDGNETKLRTFDDTTHVLLNSEGLVPTASLTVRTKIPSASSTSLLMDDISTEQQQLNTTVNVQSNNVDATMIATTEIFEETL